MKELKNFQLFLYFKIKSIIELVPSLKFCFSI